MLSGNEQHLRQWASLYSQIYRTYQVAKRENLLKTISNICAHVIRPRWVVCVGYANPVHLSTIYLCNTSLFL